jgi:hypothetical protein
MIFSVRWEYIKNQFNLHPLEILWAGVVLVVAVYWMIVKDFKEFLKLFK